MEFIRVDTTLDMRCVVLCVFLCISVVVFRMGLEMGENLSVRDHAGDRLM